MAISVSDLGALNTHTHKQALQNSFSKLSPVYVALAAFARILGMFQDLQPWQVKYNHVFLQQQWVCHWMSNGISPQREPVPREKVHLYP